MPKMIIIVGGIVMSVIALSRLLRRKRSGPMRKARKEVQRAVSDIEGTLEDLAGRAKKLSGEARETVEVQMRALEGRREELMQRLAAAANEGRKRARRSRNRHRNQEVVEPEFAAVAGN